MIIRSTPDISMAELEAALPLPALLGDLIGSGRWIHPGDQIIRRAIPLLSDPVDFRQATRFDTVTRELSRYFAEEDWARSRIHRDAEPARPLPWLDGDRAIFIAVNRVPGHDVAIALDYRVDITSPRVVASRWRPDGMAEWFEVTKGFEEFAALLGISLDG